VKVCACGGVDFYRARDRSCKECERAKARERMARWVRENPAAFKRKWKKAGRRRKGTIQHRAREMLRAAIKAGSVVRPSTCEKCGTTCKPHGHHTDYQRPLDVEWLCIPCHYRAHRAS
jgi:hypothetical protein